MEFSHHINILLTICLVIIYAQSICISLTLAQTPAGSDSITNNWAVLVSSSKFWYNYRHAANVLSIYRSIKRLGIDDSHIILMLADDTACDPRNPWPASVYNNVRHELNVYGPDAEVDYIGEEVTADNFIRLLTGRHIEGTPRSKKLLSDEGSNILIYVTGHGGDGFLKFQDKSELLAIEFADAIAQMYTKKRYNEILFVADTCQAESLSSRLYSPNIIAVGSSKTGQDSLAREGDASIGLAIIDHFTYRALEFLERLNGTTAGSTKLKKFFEICPGESCVSTVTVRRDLFKRDPAKVPLADFFSNKHKFNAVNIENDPLWKAML